MDDALPTEIALMWGLTPESRRGRRPSLSVVDITRAAIGIADEEGLAAVSMARVAQRLGNSTMALYRYVKSKDELLALMSDAALEEPPDPPEGDWRAALHAWACAALAAMRRHSWFARLPLTGPPAGPRNLRWFDRGLGALADTPLSEAEKVRIVLGLITLAHGELRMGVDLDRVHAEDPGAFGRAYAALLRRVADPRDLPAVGRVVDAGVFDHEADDPDDDTFRYSLGLYLDGVAALLHRLTTR
ncbi:TetR/AcrR family transcriptional regulator [Saccharothrix violaceirubra]|uniref:AcrR family transcriptional regulator n=1 Tax=Saccharothrix violaceirubra TaxID=413306 RepID=A0A7W7T2A8_9PSEU|nr:TetR/AcrR family transcriptional regulator [Saccharothrix violaceirubra]MBB4965273.1 AcrR family transcriptional regulator [Saccharothrix violaceirubra]